MRFISEAVWDRIVSYTGIYLSGLLLFSLVYASVVSGGGDNLLYLQVIKSALPYNLLVIPAAVIVTRLKKRQGLE